MDQSLAIQSSTEKIYKNNAIRVGTFLGGPLVAGYFIAENFKAFSEPENAKKTWIYTIVATIVIFGIAFSLPSSNRSGEYLFPLIYAWIAYYLVQHYQGTNIDSHTKAGGQFYNWGRVILVAIIGLAITLVALFAVVFAADGIASTETVKTYGTAQSEIRYDKKNISATEVDKIGQAFVDIGFFATSNKFSVLAKKIGTSYEISIACNDKVKTNPEVATVFAQLRNQMQTKFPQNKIIFNLVIDNLDNVVKRIE